MTTLAVLLSLLGTGLVWSAFVSPAASPPVPTVSMQRVGMEARPEKHPRLPVTQLPDVAGPHEGGIADMITGPVLPESEPVEVFIPRLGVQSSLVGLAVDGAGAMEVPQDPALAGWYTRGPSPGALGPAVIAGHVTWNQVPAVFFRLGQLRRGDLVRVAREDGTAAIFSVSRMARYDKTRFPTRAVFGNIDHAGLRLITCGGRYDGVSHRYSDNVVIFATLVDVRPVDK